MYMIYVIIVVFLLFAIAKAWTGSEEVEMGIELISLSAFDFELGISNRTYTLQDGGQEKEFRIGMLIVNIYILFYRNSA